MTYEELIAFSLFAFVAAATPGPNNVILTATGSTIGVRRGLPVLFGIVIGISLMIFSLAAGVGQVLLQNSETLSAIKYLGLVILLWIAWQIASAPIPEGNDVSVNTSDNLEPTGPTKKPIGFIGAVLFQWFNPKAWLSCASAIAAFMTASGSIMGQATLFAAVFFAAAFIGCLPWLALGAALKNLLKTPRAYRLFNISMGGLLLVSIGLTFVT